MSKLVRFTNRLWKNDDGATAIEYGLLAALIAVAILAIVSTLGGTLEGVFSTVNSELVTEMNN
jgi:pilus assembly protein Flp/PilA